MTTIDVCIDDVCDDKHSGTHLYERSRSAGV
jgi:hypothetical protein